MMNRLFIALFALICSDLAVSATDFEQHEVIVEYQQQKLGGTLLLPSQRKSDTLVVMTSGSGPQDRDETLDGFRIFKVLAEHLAQQGIASFRYDDRGVGQSNGSFPDTTFEQHVTDLDKILQHFSHSERFSFQSFTLLGHSQGGIVSSRVALRNKLVSKLILMAAPSVPLIDLVLYQLREQYLKEGGSRALIEADVSAHNKLMAAIRDGGDLAPVLQDFKHNMMARLTALAGSSVDNAALLQRADSAAQEHKIIYALPSLTSFLYHDTALDYQQLDVPVLALVGGNDRQVTIEQNKDVMENALLRAKTQYEFKVFDDANHYFQAAQTGERDEFSTLDKRFVDGFLDVITEWVAKH